MNIIRSLTMVVVLAGCAYQAGATTSDTYYKIVNGTDRHTSSGYQDLETFSVKFSGTTYNNVLAGGIMLSQSGTGHAVNSSMPLNYVSVCTDFLGSLYIGSTYAYTAPVDFSGQSGIAPSWNNAALAIQNADELFMTYGNIGSGGIGTGSGPTLTVQDMAALQLAVWMSLYDTGSDGKVHYSSHSEFYVTGGDSGAVALACSWVASLTGDYDSAGSLLQPDPKLGYQHNPDCHVPQELLFSSVPEPTTVLAGILLLLPLGVSTIRNLRKPQVIK